MPSPAPYTLLGDKKTQAKEKTEELLKAQAIAIGDWCIWGYSLYPIIIAMIGITTPLLDNVSSSGLSAIGYALLFTDHRMLKLRGITPPHGGWIIIGLPYIWKRCNILQKSKIPFWISTGYLVLTIFCILLTLGTA